MEDETTSCTADEDRGDDNFWDALDEFPCSDFESVTEQDRSISTSSFESFESVNCSFDLNHTHEKAAFPASLFPHLQHFSGDEDEESNSRSSSISEVVSGTTNGNSKGKKFNFSRNLEEEKSGNEEFDWSKDNICSENKAYKNSRGVALKNKSNDKLVAVDLYSCGEANESSSRFLSFLAGIVIKAITFQIHLFISFIWFPVKLMYYTYMFAIDPFGVVRHCVGYFMRETLRIWSFIYMAPVNVLQKWVKKKEPVWNAALKVGWGLLWSCYVCFTLVVLLVFAFVLGGFVMWFLVDKPIQMKDTLNFDYTQQKPVACIPIVTCPEVACGCGTNCDERVDFGEFFQARAIPRHKLEVTLSMTLPESYHNRNLGIFLVRVDLLSTEGKTLATSRHPCMLQFKSYPIQILMTFLKMAPLVFGYTSETQDIVVKFRGFTEGLTPTACIRVSIEQRAEFQPSSGIPEIYAASLSLKSQLPILKRILWYWKTTVFVWISLSMFVIELLFVLVCYNPILMPRVWLRNGASNNCATHGNRPVRRRYR